MNEGDDGRDGELVVEAEAQVADDGDDRYGHRDERPPSSLLGEARTHQLNGHVLDLVLDGELGVERFHDCRLLVLRHLLGGDHERRGATGAPDRLHHRVLDACLRHERSHLVDGSRLLLQAHFHTLPASEVDAQIQSHDEHQDDREDGNRRQRHQEPPFVVHERDDPPHDRLPSSAAV